MEVLQINNLTKRYGRITALDGLSLNIQQGEVYGILGPNGSGKSTTLGIVLNVVNRTSGSFHWFDGTNSTHNALKKVGAIIERPNFYPYMTAIQNLALVCKIKGVSKDRIKEKLKLVGLEDRQHSKFSTYSLGMKQRLAIASALLNDPEILILDEPTMGLSLKETRKLLDFVRGIKTAGKSAVFIDHNIFHVYSVADRVVVIDRGTVAGEFMTSEISLDDLMDKMYRIAETGSFEGAVDKEYSEG